MLNGYRELAGSLRDLGARPPRLGAVDAFVAAALAGDAAAVAATPPEVLAARPGVPDAVELLVSVGFDVNGYGRSDAPIDQPWHTALHVAAGDGNLRLAERLLALGADREPRDRRFDATPLGWAEHFHHRALVDLLATP